MCFKRITYNAFLRISKFGNRRKKFIIIILHIIYFKNSFLFFICSYENIYFIFYFLIFFLNRAKRGFTHLVLSITTFLYKGTQNKIFLSVFFYETKNFYLTHNLWESKKKKPVISNIVGEGPKCPSPKKNGPKCQFSEHLALNTHQTRILEWSVRTLLFEMRIFHKLKWRLWTVTGVTHVEHAWHETRMLNMRDARHCSSSSSTRRWHFLDQNFDCFVRSLQATTNHVLHTKMTAWLPSTILYASIVV